MVVVVEGGATLLTLRDPYIKAKGSHRLGVTPVARNDWQVFNLGVRDTVLACCLDADEGCDWREYWQL